VESEEWVPAGIDMDRPSPARIYDYWLGGAHNFAADRRVAEQVVAAFPGIIPVAWANRAFLRRAVEFLVDAGVRQFLDVGSGVPTVGHVHDIAQARAPDSRVVFVDIDPVAVEHSRLMLAGNALTGVVHEDVRRPEQILQAPQVQRLFDLAQPVAVLVISLLHFLPDADDPADIVSRLTAPLVPGSYLVVSHGTADGPPEATAGREIYRRSGIDMTLRNRERIEMMFAGHELVEPGLVWLPLWRPESPDDVFRDRPESSAMYAGVARKVG
jgi:S-adenosyl methyltransferase